MAKKKVVKKKAKTKKSSGQIVLDEKIGIQSVSGLVDRLDTVLKSDAEIVIDAEAVQSVDIAALQVLVAFANSARAQADGIKWKGGDGTLRQMAALADIERHLMLDSGAELVEDDGLCPVF